MEKKLIVLIDSGDTLLDESTERRDANDDVCYCELIPGAKEALEALREKEYRVVLVADGTFNSFECSHHLTGIYDLFTDRVYSEQVGVCKPAAIMFETAFKKLGLTAAEAADHAIMVGNNIERDINGANRLGITSVLLTWSKSRPMESDIPDQKPDYRIATLEELAPLCDRLEAEIAENGKLLKK